MTIRLIKYLYMIVFTCTDSFWPHTCKRIQTGAIASVHIKTIILLYPKVNPGQNPGQNLIELLIELLSVRIVSMYERALLGHCNSVPGL